MKQRKSYNELIKIFGIECIGERFAYLIESGNYFIKIKNAEKYTFLNNEIVKEIIIDYYSDIRRLKDFHIIEKVNPTKVSAYLTYWVLRKKPIQFIKQPDPSLFEKKKFLIEINEWWCVSLLLALAYDTRNPILHNAATTRRINIFLENLQYYFTYRLVNPQTLELCLHALNINPIYAPL